MNKIAACFGIALITLAQYAHSDYYVVNKSGKEYGFNWYAPDEAQIEPEPDTSPPPKEEPKNETAKQKPTGPAPMSAAWIRENLPKFRDAAVDNPSEENVAVYYYLQRVMADKATAFAQASSEVVLTNPFLDESTRRPTHSGGAKTRDNFAKINKETTHKKLAENSEIWFFYRSDDVFSNQQASSLLYLERKYNYSIRAISLDGEMIANGTFPDFDVDAGQSEALKVNDSPSTYLVRLPNTFALLAPTLVSGNQLSDRILMVAKRESWIDKQEFENTRQMKDISIARSVEDVDPRLLENPQELLEFFRDKIKKEAR